MRRAASMLVLFAGCVDLPEEYRVEDLRILEVRAEPPEIRMFEDAPLTGTPEEVLASPIELTDVRMTVLAAHPDLDATFEYQWIRCRDEPREPGCRPAASAVCRATPRRRSGSARAPRR